MFKFILTGVLMMFASNVFASQRVDTIQVNFNTHKAIIGISQGSTNSDGKFTPSGEKSLIEITEPTYTTLIATLQAQNALDLDKLINVLLTN